jgi:hypothetical protein
MLPNEANNLDRLFVNQRVMVERLFMKIARDELN